MNRSTMIVVCSSNTSVIQEPFCRVWTYTSESDTGIVFTLGQYAVTIGNTFIRGSPISVRGLNGSVREKQVPIHLVLVFILL